MSLANSRHIGRLGYYVERAAAQGVIATVSFGAGGPGRHLAAPFGGSERALNTNPIAFGVPTGDDGPFVLDYATTDIANARAWVLRDAGEPLPPGRPPRTAGPTSTRGAWSSSAATRGTRSRCSPASWAA